MLTWMTVWYVAAAICALLATFSVPTGRINLLAAAVLFLVLAMGTPTFSALIPG